MDLIATRGSMLTGGAMPNRHPDELSEISDRAAVKRWRLIALAWLFTILFGWWLAFTDVLF